MKLFLASEAKNPKTIKDLEKYINGFTGKNIAYIPTAGNGEGWGSWKEGESWNLVQTLGANITLVQLEGYWNSNIIDVLKGKDIIWFAGGYCGYLMYWIRRTRTDKYLAALLKSGCLYVGSSAGSMITGENLDIAEWFFGEEEYGVGVIPGLGLVDFDIMPHFEDEKLDYIRQKYRGNKLYLLKNGETIIVEDGKITILGEKRIIASQGVALRSLAKLN